MIRVHHRANELEAQLSAIGAGGVEAPASPVSTYVEVRECSDCGHVGINDADGSKAACNTCEWHGDSPREDKCPGCNRVGTMSAACPKCGSRTLLLAETHLLATAHPAEGVPAQAVQPSDALIEAVDAWFADNTGLGGCSDKDVAELAAIFATQPAAQGLDAETQRHAAIGKAIERACMDLPDGTEISVSLEKDAGTVTLIDQDGNEYENFSCDYGFAGVLNEAIDAAMAAHARNKKGIEQ